MWCGNILFSSAAAVGRSVISSQKQKQIFIIKMPIIITAYLVLHAVLHISSKRVHSTYKTYHYCVNCIFIYLLLICNSPNTFKRLPRG